MNKVKPKKTLRPAYTGSGFTLTEMIVVIVVLSLFVILAQMNLLNMFSKHTFKAQIQDFISTMQMAVTAASERNDRYEVIIDIDEQTYMLRRITSSELSEVLDEEIIIEGNFSENCQVMFVLFDDGDFTNNGRARFRAGRAGWAFGGKIGFIDHDQKEYSVLVNRINRTVALKEGNVELLLPRSPDEMLF